MAFEDDLHVARCHDVNEDIGQSGLHRWMQVDLGLLEHNDGVLWDIVAQDEDRKNQLAALHKLAKTSHTRHNAVW